MIRHIVFDLWGTLIKSPTNFKQERAHKVWSILQNTNPDLHLTKVTSEMRKFEKFLDGIAEMGALQYSNFNVWKLLFEVMKVKHNDNVIKTTIEEVNALFLTMAPQFYDKHTFYVLNRIYKHSVNPNVMPNNKVFMSVISNTNFTSGPIVDLYLKKLNVYHMFQYRTYSDIVMYPKPHPKIFKMHKDRLLLRDETTVMVGDNVNTDGHALRYFSKFIHINAKSGNDITHVLNHLHI